MIRSLHLMLMVCVLLCLPALAEQDESANEPERRVRSVECDAWQERIDALTNSDDALARELGELYAQPDISVCRLERVRINRLEFEPDWDIGLPEWSAFGTVIRTVTILVLIGFGLWLLWRLREYQVQRHPQASAGRAPPAAPSHRRLHEPAPLPEDIPAAARAAWQDGRPRQALSLLYRGAVTALLPARHQQGLTEREIIARLRQTQSSAETRTFMRTLINQWLSTAWAERPPENEAFETLCRQWRQHCRRTTEAGS